MRKKYHIQSENTAGKIKKKMNKEPFTSQTLFKSQEIKMFIDKNKMKMMMGSIATRYT